MAVAAVATFYRLWKKNNRVGVAIHLREVDRLRVVQSRYQWWHSIKSQVCPGLIPGNQMLAIGPMFQFQ